MTADTGVNLESYAPCFLRDFLRSAKLHPGEFGMTMEVAAEGDPPLLVAIQNGTNLLQDRSGQRRCNR